MDPTSTAVVQILEIIPDVEPTHLSQLIQTHLPTFSVFHEPETDIRGAVEREINLKDQVQGVVGLVLHLLLENPNHPKVDRRAGGQGKWKRVLTYDADVVGGKSKGKSKDISVVKPEIDYTSIDRPFPDSQNYFDLALVCPFPPLSNFSDSFSPSITSKYPSHASQNPTSVVNSSPTNIYMRLPISPS
jgi:E3 ubiquitin-protein ligase RNF216